MNQMIPIILYTLVYNITFIICIYIMCVIRIKNVTRRTSYTYIVTHVEGGEGKWVYVLPQNFSMRFSYEQTDISSPVPFFNRFFFCNKIVENYKIVFEYCNCFFFQSSTLTLTKKIDTDGECITWYFYIRFS